MARLIQRKEVEVNNSGSDIFESPKGGGQASAIASRTMRHVRFGSCLHTSPVLVVVS